MYAAKTQRRDGALGHERLTIRKHASRDTMFRFLCHSDNSWTEYTGDLPPGVYAFCGGRWQNVRYLDPSLLPHV